MPKAYLWDWSLVPDRAARFENLVALAPAQALPTTSRTSRAFAVELHYLRDREGREVDFLVTSGRKPWFAVEVKLSETRVDPALVHFKERLRIPWAYQVDARGRAGLRAGRRARRARRAASCRPSSDGAS